MGPRSSDSEGAARYGPTREVSTALAPARLAEDAARVGELALEAVEHRRGARFCRCEELPGVGLDLDVQLVGAPTFGRRERCAQRLLRQRTRGRERASPAEPREIHGHVEVAAPF